MEGIAGFNFEYNDVPEGEIPELSARRRMEKADDAVALSPTSSRRKDGFASYSHRAAGFAQAPTNPNTGLPFFHHTNLRADLRAKGKSPGFEVINQARARSDGAALRASDGAVLKMPYSVRLKGR